MSLVKLHGFAIERDGWTRDVWVRPSDVSVVDDESSYGEERTSVVLHSGHRVVVHGTAATVMRTLGIES